MQSTEYQFKPCYERVLQIFWLKKYQKPEGVTSRLKVRQGVGGRENPWDFPRNENERIKLINLKGDSEEIFPEPHSLDPAPSLDFNLQTI